MFPHVMSVIECEQRLEHDLALHSAFNSMAKLLVLNNNQRYDLSLYIPLNTHLLMLNNLR